MRRMKVYGAYFGLSVLLVSVFLVDSQVPINLEKDNVYDMNRLCASVAVVKDYLDIHINNLRGSRACNVTLEPDEKKNTLKAYFKKYAAGDACSGAINLYDSRNFAQLGNEGYCKSDTPKEHYELGTSGILTVAQGDSSIDAVVRVVEYYIKDKECPAGKFDCEEKKLCIGKSIACDTSADCPNAKDEGAECKTIKWRPIHTLIVFVGIVVVFCVCATIVWEETSRQKRGNRRLQLPTVTTFAPGPFDGAYTQNFEEPVKKPTVYLPASSSPPGIPATTASPV